MNKPELHSLPAPPSAEELTLEWWSKNKSTIAAYLAAVYAMSRAQIIVNKNGTRLPAVAIQIAGPSATTEITV